MKKILLVALFALGFNTSLFSEEAENKITIVHEVVDEIDQEFVDSIEDTAEIPLLAIDETAEEDRQH